MGVNQQSNQEIVMKRNESKSVKSVIAAAVVALLAAGCVTVPSGDFAEDHVETYLPVDRGTGA